MAFQWTRRVLLALAPAALLALAACDSSTIESQFRPTRVVAFGDALSDMGQVGNEPHTIDNSTDVWVNFLARSYGVQTPLKPAAAGGTVYATTNARVTAKPDAAGNAATPTIKEQIDTFLAGQAFGPNDLVIMQGGISDLIVHIQAHRAGTLSRAQLLAAVRQTGLDFAAQARRVVAAGAQHVLIVGMYDLAVTPWGIGTGIQSVVSEASRTFNDTVLVELVTEGQHMLFIDTALLYNLMVNNPTGYAFDSVTAPVCTSLDPGPGIGIGTNQVSARQCTSANPATIVAGANVSRYLWADPVYPTSSGHSRLAEYAYSRVIQRW